MAARQQSYPFTHHSQFQMIDNALSPITKLRIGRDNPPVPGPLASAFLEADEESYAHLANLAILSCPKVHMGKRRNPPEPRQRRPISGSRSTNSRSRSFAFLLTTLTAHHGPESPQHDLKIEQQ